MKNAFTMFFIIAISASLVFAQSETKKTNTGTTKINKTSATNAAVYDFTTGSDKYYGGTSGAVEVETGVWGMIAGDANSDGAVDAVDKNTYWRVENGTTYDYTKYSDFNLDGNLDAVDKNSYWRPNNGKSTQVPN